MKQSLEDPNKVMLSTSQANKSSQNDNQSESENESETANVELKENPDSPGQIQLNISQAAEPQRVTVTENKESMPSSAFATEKKDEKKDAPVAVKTSGVHFSEAELHKGSDNVELTENENNGNKLNIDRKPSRGLKLTKSDADRLSRALGTDRSFSVEFDDLNSTNSAPLVEIDSDSRRESEDSANPFAKSREVAIPSRHSRKPSTDANFGSHKSEGKNTHSSNSFVAIIHCSNLQDIKLKTTVLGL